MRFGAFALTAALVTLVAIAPTQAWAAKEKKSAAKPVKKVANVKSTRIRPADSVPTSRKPAETAASLADEALALSDVQLVLASMVQTGRADCEFQQMVMVEPNLRQLGGFLVKFQNAAYRMVPEQTTTGAIRLVDERAGVTWLQIRYKSMLMNSRAGQRMVDACSMPAQRLAEAEAERVLKAAVDNPPQLAEGEEAPKKELPLLSN